MTNIDTKFIVNGRIAEHVDLLKFLKSLYIKMDCDIDDSENDDKREYYKRLVQASRKQDTLLDYIEYDKTFITQFGLPPDEQKKYNNGSQTYLLDSVSEESHYLYGKLDKLREIAISKYEEENPMLLMYKGIPIRDEYKVYVKNLDSDVLDAKIAVSEIDPDIHPKTKDWVFGDEKRFEKLIENNPNSRHLRFTNLYSKEPKLDTLKIRALNDFDIVYSSPKGIDTIHYNTYIRAWKEAVLTIRSRIDIGIHNSIFVGYRRYLLAMIYRYFLMAIGIHRAQDWINRIYTVPELKVEIRRLGLEDLLYLSDDEQLYARVVELMPDILKSKNDDLNILVNIMKICDIKDYNIYRIFLIREYKYYNKNVTNIHGDMPYNDNLEVNGYREKIYPQKSVITFDPNIGSELSYSDISSDPRWGGTFPIYDGDAQNVRNINNGIILDRVKEMPFTSARTPYLSLDYVKPKTYNAKNFSTTFLKLLDERAINTSDTIDIPYSGISLPISSAISLYMLINTMYGTLDLEDTKIPKDATDIQILYNFEKVFDIETSLNSKPAGGSSLYERLSESFTKDMNDSKDIRKAMEELEDLIYRPDRQYDYGSISDLSTYLNSPEITKLQVKIDNLERRMGYELDPERSKLLLELYNIYTSNYDIESFSKYDDYREAAIDGSPTREAYINSLIPKNITKDNFWESVKRLRTSRETITKAMDAYLNDLMLKANPKAKVVAIFGDRDKDLDTIGKVIQYLAKTLLSIRSDLIRTDALDENEAAGGTSDVTSIKWTIMSMEPPEVTIYPILHPQPYLYIDPENMHAKNILMPSSRLDINAPVVTFDSPDQFKERVKFEFDGDYMKIAPQMYHHRTGYDTDTDNIYELHKNPNYKPK